VLADLFEELMTAVVYTCLESVMEVLREQMFKMIRFALVALVLFVSKKMQFCFMAWL
jgi:hypothetical protein